jgi:2-oxoglutarate ferredoxin oxidoreductase subunit gamma
MVLNVAMVGFLCAITQVISREACRQAVEESVPSRFRQLNLDAFDKGFAFGEELRARGPAPVEHEHAAEIES